MHMYLLCVYVYKYYELLSILSNTHDFCRNRAVTARLFLAGPIEERSWLCLVAALNAWDMLPLADGPKRNKTSKAPDLCFGVTSGLVALLSQGSWAFGASATALLGHDHCMCLHVVSDTNSVA